jgi:hypothetical protein
VVFLDAREFPDAYRIAGRYVIEGDRVTVRLRVFRGRERSETVTAEASVEDLGVLAEIVVSAAQRLLE